MAFGEKFGSHRLVEAGFTLGGGLAGAGLFGFARAYADQFHIGFLQHLPIPQFSATELMQGHIPTPELSSMSELDVLQSGAAYAAILSYMLVWGKRIIFGERSRDA